MNKKIEAAKLISDKLRGKTYLSYVEIANITGYHPKYILKLKKEGGLIAAIIGVINPILSS